MLDFERFYTKDVSLRGWESNPRPSGYEPADLPLIYRRIKSREEGTGPRPLTLPYLRCTNAHYPKQNHGQSLTYQMVRGIEQKN